MTSDKAHADATAKGRERKRMVVFYGKDAKIPEPDAMPIEGMDEAVMAGLARITDAQGHEGQGDKLRVIFSEPGEDGMSLLWAWFKSGYVLPRHSHSADCLYYVIAGELRMGSHVLKKGDGFFVPKDHAYGYEAGPDGVEILEFRNATRFNFVFKGNDDAWWDRVATAFRERPPAWENETVPPSDR